MKVSTIAAVLLAGFTIITGAGFLIYFYSYDGACMQIVTVENGKVIYDLVDGEKVRQDGTATIHCNQGFHHQIPSRSVARCMNGQWEPAVITICIADPNHNTSLPLRLNGGRILIFGGMVGPSNVSVRGEVYYNSHEFNHLLEYDQYLSISGCAVAIIDHDVYLAGGQQRLPDGSFGSATNRLYIYLVDLNKTAWGPEMFQVRVNPGGTAYEKKFYVCGGEDDKWKALESCEVFDPNIKQWEMMPEMLDAKTSFSLIALDQHLYAFGDGVTVLSSNEAYSFAIASWKKIAKLPSKDQSGFHAASTFCGAVVVCGQSGINKKSCYVYIPSTNKWFDHQINELKSDVNSLFSLININDTYLVEIGKGSNYDVMDNSVTIYDASINQWSDAIPLLVGRHLPSAVYYDPSVLNLSSRPHISLKSPILIFGGLVEESVTEIFGEAYFNNETVRLFGHPPTFQPVHSAIGLIGTKVYITCGQRSSIEEPDKTLYIYDLNGEFSQGPSPPNTDCIGAGSAVYDNKFFVCGGQSDQSSHYVPSRICMVYDPSTDKWSRLSDMKYAHKFFSLVAQDGFLYAVANSKPGEVFCEKYNISSDMWTLTANYPINAWSAAATIHPHGIVSCGGEWDFKRKIHRSCFLYVPSEDRWYKDSIASMNQPRLDFKMINIGNEYLFVIGGTRVSFNERSWTLENKPKAAA